MIHRSLARCGLLLVCALCGCGARTRLRVPDDREVLVMDLHEVSPQEESAPERSELDVIEEPDVGMDTFLDTSEVFDERDAFDVVPEDVIAETPGDIALDLPLDQRDVWNDLPEDRVSEDRVVMDLRPPATGCADGTREAFVDEMRFPKVAGCAGGWSIAGVHPPPARRCATGSGNTSSNPLGMNCSAQDLCAVDFHVCVDAAEFARNSPTRDCSNHNAPPDSFFATGQSSNGCNACALGTRVDRDCDGESCTAECLNNANTTNDLYGCGTLGTTVSCGALNRASNNLCGDLNSNWSCGSDGLREARNVVLRSFTNGGVLCCHN